MCDYFRGNGPPGDGGTLWNTAAIWLNASCQTLIVPGNVYRPWLPSSTTTPHLQMAWCVMPGTLCCRHHHSKGIHSPVSCSHHLSAATVLLLPGSHNVMPASALLLSCCVCSGAQHVAGAVGSVSGQCRGCSAGLHRGADGWRLGRPVLHRLVAACLAPCHHGNNAAILNVCVYALTCKRWMCATVHACPADPHLLTTVFVPVCCHHVYNHKSACCCCCPHWRPCSCLADAPLGDHYDASMGKHVISVWAPTAHIVELLHWEQLRGGEPTVFAMTRSAQGVWSYVRPAEWKGT